MAILLDIYLPSSEKGSHCEGLSWPGTCYIAYASLEVMVLVSDFQF